MAVVVAVTALVVVACGGAGPSASARAPGIAATPRAATSAETAAALVVDDRLLLVLPTLVAGAEMQHATDSAATMIGNTELARSASGVAVGLVAAGSASGGDDLAVSTVVQLRPGVFSDDFYRDWRTAYDEAACEPSGGVASHIQQLIGPHTVEVTVCGQGARTYHTRLPGDRLVSITAVGDRKFGDLVMAGLRQ